MFKSKNNIAIFNIVFSVSGFILFSLLGITINTLKDKAEFDTLFVVLGVFGILAGQTVFWALSIKRFFYRSKTTSVLELLNVETKERTVLKKFPNTIIESPNWRTDRNSIIYNSKGRIFNYDINTGEVSLVDTGFLVYCNNDHVLAPDGSGIGISHNSKKVYMSRIYTLRWASSKPVLITEKAPSYLHGWSPDGKTLAYCAKRKGQYDIYTIPVTGGEEIQITNSKGHNDGPEYSPDGKYIWFNSARNGLMQIWRMNADGTEQTQITFDDNCNSWFPHISPDGKRVVYLTFKKFDIMAKEHLPNKDVELRIMNYDGSGTETLATLFGGQGTINTYSWSPCGKYVAFVSYERK